MAPVSPMSPATPIVVLHAPGDARAGAPWREALAAAGWNGPVIAPDLPGHGSAPSPPGGSYELGDALLSVIPEIAALADDAPAPIVVGCGTNGWCAQILGLGGRASAVVLVDGLNGPWRTPRQAIEAGVEWLRRLADDPDAIAPPPPAGLDPRLRHPMGGLGNRAYAFRCAAAMPVPALIVETGGSLVPDDDVDALAVAHPAGAGVVRLETAEADEVVRHVVESVLRTVART